MFIVKYRNFFFVFSGILIVLALGAMFKKGFNIGIDFTGGSIIEASYGTARPDLVELEKNLVAKFPGTYTQAAGEKDIIVRTKDLNEKEHSDMLNVLSVNNTNPVTEKKFSSIGPTIGKELRSRAWAAILSVLLLIMLW